MANPRTIKVVVSVPLLQGDALQTAVAELREIGLEVDSVLDKIGLVTGMVAENKLAKLRQVEGVASAREEKAIHLACANHRRFLNQLSRHVPALN